MKKIKRMAYIFAKRLVLSIIRGKCGNKFDKIFNEDESIEMLKTLVLTENIQIR